jgi:hypothetical protein
MPCVNVDWHVRQVFSDRDTIVTKNGEVRQEWSGPALTTSLFIPKGIKDKKKRVSQKTQETPWTRKTKTPIMNIGIKALHGAQAE